MGGQRTAAGSWQWHCRLWRPAPRGGGDQSALSAVACAGPGGGTGDCCVLSEGVWSLQRPAACGQRETDDDR